MKQPKPQSAPDASRFGLLIESLERVSAKLVESRDPLLAEEVRLAAHWLRQYCEPWLCPACGLTLKVPDSDRSPRDCPKCGGDRMFPYAYLEVERMSAQMTLMLGGLTHYAKRGQGHVAQQILSQVGDVKLTGSWRPPVSTGADGRSRTSVPFWRRLFSGGRNSLARD